MAEYLGTILTGALVISIAYLAIFIRIPNPATLQWSDGIAEKAAACKLPQYDVRPLLLQTTSPGSFILSI
jgi:hypothetical protein